jgi:hypothetical protein
MESDGKIHMGGREDAEAKGRGAQLDVERGRIHMEGREGREDAEAKGRVVQMGCLGVDSRTNRQ